MEPIVDAFRNLTRQLSYLSTNELRILSTIITMVADLKETKKEVKNNESN